MSRRTIAGLQASVADSIVVYAIGDIHGRFDLLTDLLQLVSTDRTANPQNSDALIVFLGDYVDRGPDSKRVINFVATGSIPGFRVVYLKGNHEEAMLDFLDDRSDGSDWLTYGGLETLYSYGVQLKGIPSNANAVIELREAVRRAVPSEHIAFLRMCALTHVEGDYLFVHAGVRPGIPLDRQDPSDLLWIRDDFLASRRKFENKVVVHGHTICDEPQDRPYRINIDTGAFASGKLTSVVLRGTTRRFLTTGLRTVRR